MKRLSLYHAQYRESHREKNRLYCIEYRAAYPEKISFLNKRSRSLRRAAGDLPTSVIQRVYEENVKTNGTLTCYLCNLPIEFGKDHLEHRTPICRGGTNDYSNLAVAHSYCNVKKGRKTYEEFICN